jgi:hypothetical protein
MEIWKDIEGYEEKYQVSNLGNVKSLERYVNHWQGGVRVIRERILKPINKKGYLHVDLSEGKQHKIHRLVAYCFLGPNSKEVNHIDLDKTNNNVNNLEYVTRSENMNHNVKNNNWNNQWTINKVGQLTK